MSKLADLQNQLAALDAEYDAETKKIEYLNGYLIVELKNTVTLLNGVINLLR